MLAKPTIPQNDSQRLKALHSYGILNTVKEIEYDQITQLATNLTGMPVSLISFVDENEVWFKSTKGMDICSADRDVSFCSYAVGADNGELIINNTATHEAFKHHPFAKLDKDPIVFYAGMCLIDKDGYKLGTLCVIDHKPNSLNDKQKEGLETLAKQVVKLIELHKANDDLKETQVDLEKKNEELKNFAGVVSHDMKMPLANIILTTDILKAKYASQLDAQAIDYLKYLKNSSFTLSDYISGILSHYESDKLAEGNSQTFDIHHLLEEIVELLNIKHDCEINFPETNIDINCNRAALEQIFLNLIGNSLKYNDKDTVVINIECEEKNNQYFFIVNDNGMGIPKDKQESIFELYTTLGNIDRNGNKGNGIGLSTVKKLINSLGGMIQVSSTEGKSTTFEFSIDKK